jgi:hypothetical protein
MTPQELELLTTLPSDPAYILLIDKLQAIADDLTDTIGATTDEKKTLELLPYWRALRYIVGQLRTVPGDVVALLETQYKEDLGLKPNQQTNQKVREIFKQMHNNSKTGNPYPPLESGTWGNTGGYGNLI